MTEQIFHDVACTACACVCDDLTVTVRDGRIVDYRPFCSRIGNWFSQQNSKPYPVALVNGVETPFDEAVDQAAKILVSAFGPLVYGLSQSSTEGQRAAIGLADYLGATIDTTASEGHAPSILALQQVGESTSSLGEIRNRSDLVIYWGADPMRIQPRHLERYSMRDGLYTPNGRDDRTLVVIDAEPNDTAKLADWHLKIEQGRDFEALWTLRSLLKGIEPAEGTPTGLPLDELRKLAEMMRTCRSGVVFFGHGLVLQPHGHQNAQALLQLVIELNQHTRFYARRMRVMGNVSGADCVLCWQTGFPFSVSLSRGYPRYCPEEYAAGDLLERQEVDAVMLVGSARVDRFTPRGLDHLKQIPTILLEHPYAETPFEPTVRFTTAVYGIHEAGTAYRMDEVPIPLRPLLHSDYPTDQEVASAIHNRVRQLLPRKR